MPSYEDQEFKEMREKFADTAIPDTPSGYDISDGRHIGVVVDVGRRIVGEGYRQAYIQFDIVSEGKDKGGTPQAAFFLPDDDALKLPKDSDEYRRAMNGIVWLNDAYVRITGKAPYSTVGALLTALDDGSLLRALKGRRVELQVSHRKAKDGNEYPDVRVRRGIGPTVAETPPFTPKPTKPRTAKKKAPARRNAAKK